MTSTLIPFPSTPPLTSPTVRRLPNGLTIVAEQIPVEAVNLNIWIDIGSAVESDSINGMAHFLEHMVFKGTQRLQSGEFEKQVEERGPLPMQPPARITPTTTSQQLLRILLN